MRLFEQYSKNLELVIQRIAPNSLALFKGNYVCPICFRIFTKEQVQLLSKDHVPPQSVGGKDIVLTCGACNNNQGAEIDKHLKRAHEGTSFLKRRPKSSVYESLQTSDLSFVKSKISITEEGGYFFRLDKKNSKPSGYEAFFKILDAEDPWTINFN